MSYGSQTYYEEAESMHNREPPLCEQCDCGMPAVQRTCGPTTKNAGRQFFSCGKGKDDATNCGYFRFDGEKRFGARKRPAQNMQTSLAPSSARPWAQPPGPTHPPYQAAETFPYKKRPRPSDDQAVEGSVAGNGGSSGSSSNKYNDWMLEQSVQALENIILRRDSAFSEKWETEFKRVTDLVGEMVAAQHMILEELRELMGKK